MKQIKIMLWFDVEDFITPESDDALNGILDMMDSLGIRGSFKIVGEKIRVLAERGRRDILEKLTGHEICYHTENHSVHPTQPADAVLQLYPEEYGISCPAEYRVSLEPMSVHIVTY